MCHFQTSAWLLSSALYTISKETVDVLLHIYQLVLEQKKKKNLLCYLTLELLVLQKRPQDN